MTKPRRAGWTPSAVRALGRLYPHPGLPRDDLLAVHQLLFFVASVILALAFLLSASPHPRPPPLPRRALAASLFAAAGALLCVCAAAPLVPEDAGWAAVAGLGLRMAVLGTVFSAHYFGRRRWLLEIFW